MLLANIALRGFSSLRDLVSYLDMLGYNVECISEDRYRIVGNGESKEFIKDCNNFKWA